MSFQNRVYVTSAGSLEILWPQKMTNPLINSGVRCSLLHKICSPVDRNPSSFSCPELPQIPMPISIQVRPDIVGTLTAEGKVSLHLHSIIFFRWQKTGDFGSFGLWRCCLLILIGIKIVYMQAYLQKICFFCEAWLVGFLVDGLQSILWGKELGCDLHPRRWTRNSQSTHADTETSENTKPVLPWWTHLIVENKQEKAKECRLCRKSWILGGCLNFLPTFSEFPWSPNQKCSRPHVHHLESNWSLAVSHCSLLESATWYLKAGKSQLLGGRGKPRPSTVALPPSLQRKRQTMEKSGEMLK